MTEPRVWHSNLTPLRFLERSANVFRDIGAQIRNITGGRAAGYEKELRKARETAITEMEAQATELGADAIVGVDIDYETVGGSMLMVTAAGTAVKLG